MLQKVFGGLTPPRHDGGYSAPQIPWQDLGGRPCRKRREGEKSETGKGKGGRGKKKTEGKAEALHHSCF